MKVALMIIFFLLVNLLFAADLSPQLVGDETLLTLRIDSNDLFSKKGEIAYRMIFELFDENNKSVYLAKEDIELKSDKLENNQRLIFFLKTQVEPGQYTAFLKLNNKLRNDKKEEKFEFFVEKNQHFSALYLVKKMENIYMEVLSWEDIETSNNIYLYQLYETETQTLKFVSESKNNRKVSELPTSKELLTKLKADYLIEDFTNNYIEFKLANDLYQSELKLEKYLNSFQKKYSWEDQLSQIKYIVNDKTWKEINRNKNWTDSEKVLQFWASNNPKESQNSSLQDLFYNRILQADRKFSVHRYKQGWQTDRGRIYIKFGEPDEISVDNNPVGRYPTQTWHYYRLNKTFIFYDRSRIEDYKLYNKEEEYDF